MANEKRFVKGLFKDTAHIDQPEGSWRYARNIIMSEKDGSISNEGGNTPVQNIQAPGKVDYLGGFVTSTENYKCIGSIPINDDKIIFFFRDRRADTDTTLYTSEIGLFDPSKDIGLKYTILYRPQPVLPIIENKFKGSNNLNFSIDHPIEGTFKIDSRENVIIYWTDDFNSPRTFNVTRQLASFDTGGNFFSLYNLPPALAGNIGAYSTFVNTSTNTTHIDHIDLLNLFPNSGPVPHIDLDDVYSIIPMMSHQRSVVEGGGLRTGVYYLALAYIDEDFVSTNYLTVSNPVSIVDEYDHTRPTTRKDGAKEGSQTSKAIKWKITNINTDYKFLRPVVIRKMGEATDAFKLSDIDLKVAGDNGVVFSGIEGFASASVEEVIIDTISYDTVKTINQLDGVLYLGNLTKTTDLGYQPYANNIKLSPVVKTIPDFDVFYATVDNFQTGFGNQPVDSGNDVDASRSYRYAPNIFKYKGYTRDEVYAFYIAFVMNDGSMSYAYHIPGREALGEELSYVNNASISNTGNASNYILEDLADLSTAYARKFHFFDTSTNANARNMNYWQNATEFYPETNDYWVFDGYVNTNDDGSPVNPLTPSIQGLNVRHHHFPSNSNDEYKTISGHCMGKWEITQEEGSVGASIQRNGRMLFGHNNSTRRVVHGESWTKMLFKNPDGQAGWAGSLDITEQEALGLFDGEKFTADGTYNIRVRGCTWIRKECGVGGGNNCCGSVMTRYRIETAAGGTQTMAMPDGSEADDVCGFNGNSVNGFNDKMCWNAPGGTDTTHTLKGNWTNWHSVNIGDQIWVESKSDDPDVTKSDEKLRQEGGGCTSLPVWCDYCDGCGQQTQSWLQNDEFFVKGNNSAYWPPNSDLGDYDNPGHTNLMPNYLDNTPGSIGRQWRTTHLTRSWIEIQISTGDESTGDPDFKEGDYHDAKVCHDVQRLGFTLDDIKIPKSIADKVQGFRIYYAKRDHEHRRILGQGLFHPMLYKFDLLGICKEADDGTDTAMASQILATLTSTKEQFYNVDPYIRDTFDYPLLDIWNSTSDNPTNFHAWKNFSFHDFYLLRSKNSLAGATHIKTEYKIFPFVWNGMSLQQDKKMNIKLDNFNSDDWEDADNPEPIDVREVWGWDAERNCYPERIRSVITMGGWYFNYQYKTDFYEYPRVLGQKAKTYLLGDSVFKGKSLGFGGKLFNEFGESCMALGLKDGHELRALWSDDRVNEDAITAGAEFGNFGQGANFNLGGNPDSYGFPHTAAYAVLTNPWNFPGTNFDDADNWSGKPDSTNDTDPMGFYLINLHAFKSDVYKSIDSNELVWTGFEVLGNDMDNFIFNDIPGNGLGLGAPMTVIHGGYNQSADFSLDTLQGQIFDMDLNERGIFGGDTFICRYAHAASLKPSNTGELSNPRKAIHSAIVESTDNISLRHIESDKSLYFPGASAFEILKNAGTPIVDETIGNDFTHVDNIKYNTNYSENNDLRPAFPLPLRLTNQTEFSTRTHRSAKNDATSLIDNYRVFLANQFKDLPKNRGELWKLSTFNNLLYFHMEESLYATKGKQQMEIKDGSEAFVGSGDIFAQEPDEVLQSEGGYGGTQSQWAALTTRNGYFFVDALSRKVFLMADALQEISAIGMKKWFRDNLKFVLEDYGLKGYLLDNPIRGIGLHSTWDPKHKRIILTKRDLKPSSKFISDFKNKKPNTPVSGDIWFDEKLGVYVIATTVTLSGDAGQIVALVEKPLDWNDSTYFTKTGWTISFYPDLMVWISFHDYIPYHYFDTSIDFYSFTDSWDNYINGDLYETGVLGPNVAPGDNPQTLFGNGGVWKHNGDYRGILYQDVFTPFDVNGSPANLIHYPTEFEFVHNSTKIDQLFSSFSFYSDTFTGRAWDDSDAGGSSIIEHGWNTIYMYNTLQMFYDDLTYLINTRRINNEWKFNRFRDMAALSTNDTSPGYFFGQAGSHGGVPGYTPTSLAAEASVAGWDHWGFTQNNIIGQAPIFTFPTNVGTLETSSANANIPFLVSGMYETLNNNYVDSAKRWDLRKKFIDKWIGIRLICNNESNNLLNLYATSVATRKFYR